MTDKPKLSIITINFNNKDGLRRTLESIKLQTCKDFEYIVIDGGSTDGSVELIKDYNECIDYWVTEPDKGVFNAMNKGVEVAHGDFCQFLNSGDWLSSNLVVEIILPYLKEDIDILTCGIYNKWNNQWCETLPPDYLSLRKFVLNSLSHQGSYIKTENLKKYPYNEEYKVVSDWEYFTNAYLRKERFKALPYFVAFFDAPGLSGSNEIHSKERIYVKQNFVYPALNEEISVIPPQLYEIMEYSKNSPRFQNALCKIVSIVTHLFCVVKRTPYKLGKRYKKLKGPKLTKEQLNRSNFLKTLENQAN